MRDLSSLEITSPASLAQSKEEQKKVATQYLSKPLRQGEKWYLIANEWFVNWNNYIGFKSAASKTIGTEPKKINNRNLLDYDDTLKKYVLKESLVENTDYVTIPEELWNYLSQIYSVETPEDVIQRFVINDSMDDFNDDLKVELHYLKINLTTSNWNKKDTICEEFSRQTKLENLIEHMKKLFNVPNDRKCRLFFKTSNDLTAIEVNQNSTLNSAGCGVDDTIVLDVQSETGSWINDQLTSRTKTPTPKIDSALSNSMISSSTSPQQQTTSTFNTRQSTRNFESYSYSNRHNDFKPGLCGLSNLGNTCFMNSAIQCMSNVPLLTDYFRQDDYKNEINLVNPLGCKGELAEAYADLVKEIWSGSNSYTVPRNFKLNLSRFAPQFTGFQQQDSQELLAFLLDGLHEDLNRIIKKPYVELGSHVGKTDEVFAEESWQDHKKRNDSVIVDIFHGLLKSTLNCLECKEISIKFDPFCYLSVPLPSKRERLIEVFFVPLDQTKQLVKYKVSVLRNGNMQDLCGSLESLFEKDGFNVPKNRMIVCDVYSNKFFKIYEPTEPVSSIKERDDIYVYELASNYNNNDFYKVKLHLREKSSYMHSSNCFGLPLFFMVPKENLTYGLLYNHVHKILKRFLKEPTTSLASDEINSKLNNSLNVNDDEPNKPVHDENSSNQNENLSENEKVDDEDNSDIGADNSQNSVRTSDRLKAKQAQKNKLFQIIASKNENFEYDSSTGNNPPTDETPFEWPVNQSSSIRDSYSSSYGSSNSNNQIVSLVADFSSNSNKRLYNKKAIENFVEHPSCNSQLVKKKDVINLSDCFSLYTKTEELSEQDYWYCSKCKNHQPSTKKFDLWKLPKVLVVHLKRFSYSRMYRDKIDTLVEFPLTDLDMSSYIINKNSGETKYNLIAVSNHYGSLGGGHYTAYGLNRHDGRWYYFDDSSVSSSDENSVCTNAAYLLVYLRKDLFKENIHSKTENGYNNDSYSEKMDY